MNTNFVRSGPLMHPASYPVWLQEIIANCAEARRAVTEHELFKLMSDNELSHHSLLQFFTGVWPVIEQFPQYMAMNLLKVQYGSLGHEMARKYLIRNIRVEQSHAEYWIDWAQAHGVSRAKLLSRQRSGCVEALSHWCWHTCERDALATAMAATNYAIEGVTGEWAAQVSASEQYANGFPIELRRRAMKWLRAHAEYDDTHPWEALDIIATLLGRQPAMHDIGEIQTAILKSYEYMHITLDYCLTEDITTQSFGSPAIAVGTSACSVAH
ncbi:MAG: iron-containing redox enzyme family protein [Steroidobacteraceae bacterium]